MPKRRRIIPYHPRLKELARKLRNNMTYPEILLWQQLKGTQMAGHDFDRQRPIDQYIVDFYCKDLGLIIEIDGTDHFDEAVAANDLHRAQRLRSFGLEILRFSNLEVKTKMPMVLRTIEQCVEALEERA